MKSKDQLRIALAQLTSSDNIERNVNLICKAIQKTAGKKVDLICFPENALFLRINSNDPKFIYFNLYEPFWKTIQKHVNETGTRCLIGSIGFQRGQRKSNATVYLEPQKKPKVVYHKIHLFDVAVNGAVESRESDFFIAGKRPETLNIFGWKLGLSICYDLRFSELFHSYAKQGVDAILVPAAFLVQTGQDHWHTLLKARAIESQAFVLASAQCGGHRGKGNLRRETYGHSLAIDPWGNTLADLGNKTRGYKIAIVDISKSRLESVREQIPMARHRQLR